jgi:hypothetical protein
MPTLEPTELVRAAGRFTELVFAHEYGKVPWLLVRLGAEDDQLAAALRAADAQVPSIRPPGQLGFHTEVLSEAPIRLKREGEAASDPDWATLVRGLGDDTYYAVPIRKRTDVDAAFGERISIGRALNKDLVFRHASISKFHAYFQLGAPYVCALADAGSKNGTTVNGSRIPPKGVVEVVSGDRVTFGSVRTVVLDARTLWRVIRLR